jgi:hypothetical protein
LKTTNGWAQSCATFCSTVTANIARKNFWINNKQNEMNKKPHPLLTINRISWIPIAAICIISCLLLLFISCNNNPTHSTQRQLIPFQKDKLWGYCNYNKEEVIKPMFTSVGFFSEGLACVSVEKGKDWVFGFIDTSGNFVIEPEFDIPTVGAKYRNGLAIVNKNQKYKLIDKLGQIQIEADYIDFDQIKNWYTVMPLSDGGLDYYDTNFRKINNRALKDFPVFGFSEGWAAVKYYGEDEYVFVNQNFKQVLPKRFAWAGNFDKGRALVWDGRKYFFIDKNGNLLFMPPYEQVEIYSEGLAPVAVRAGDKYAWGFIDETGNVVIKLQFDIVSNFSEDLATVWIDDKKGYIDKTGQLVIPAIYDNRGGQNYSNFKNGRAMIVKNGFVGVIDRSGQEIIPFEYKALNLQENGWYLANKDQFYGFIDSEGVEVIPFKYIASEDFKDGYAKVRLFTNSKTIEGYIDTSGKEYFVDD